MNKYTISIGTYISIVALLISLWNLLNPYFSNVKVKIIPESQVQIMEAILPPGTSTTAFNVFFTIVSKGPESKWEIFKFYTAQVTTPNNRKINFECRSYLDEKGMGQSNNSRNIPITINGNSSKNLTVAFQSVEFQSWIIGKYSIEFTVRTTDEKNITVKKMEFIINENNIKIIKIPNSILMMDSKLF